MFSYKVFLKLLNLLKHKINLLLTCNFSKLGLYHERDHAKVSQYKVNLTFA